MLCEAAKHYLEANYIGHDLPLKAWEAEREELNAEHGKAYHEYGSLRGQVFEVETIRREAEQIVREINPPEPQKDTREKGLER